MSQRKLLRVTAGLVAALALAAAYALAGGDAKKDPPAKDPSAEAKQAAASGKADPAREMEAYLAMMRPGKEHAALKRMVGEFDVDVEMVMQPGAPPTRSKGKEKAALIMGGRYLHGDYTGDMMGTPFHGAGLTGYDTYKKKYFSAWIDDMSTGIIMGEGTASADGKVITMKGEFDDPMAGARMKYRWVTTFVSDDQYTFDWFQSDKDGKNEFRMMHNTYSRVK